MTQSGSVRRRATVLARSTRLTGAYPRSFVALATGGCEEDFVAPTTDGCEGGLR